MSKEIFSVSSEEIKELVFKKAKEFSISPYLILGIIKKESAFNNQAVRYEQNWRWPFNIEMFAKLNKITFNTENNLQSHSWGLMQVMGTVARELGHRGTFFELLIPDVNLTYGCLKLASLLKKYSTEDNAISAYNQGNVRRLADGRYANFDYVDQVKQFKREFEGLSGGINDDKMDES